MKELPAKACFLWSLAETVPACLLRCAKLVYFFIDASVLVFLTRMAWYRRGRVWYSAFYWYIVFSQLGFVHKKHWTQVKNFCKSICSLFSLFPTIDCIFHVYVCIHLWVGREGEQCLSCRNGQSITWQLPLLLILKYVMDGVYYSNLVVAERLLKGKSASFRKNIYAVLGQVLNQQVLPHHQDDPDLLFPSSKTSLNPCNPESNFQWSKRGHWMYPVCWHASMLSLVLQMVIASLNFSF